ncbi:MAG TPA: GNAT family N-acetyltransferase [Candidatus Paceibacterota bacterium]|nr:GNAT family N-acetyltransferase [Candidatus Paceibacterota bacterium]
MKSPIITSPNYRIRPFKMSDAELWQTWDTDLEVQKFMPEPFNEPQDIEEQYAYIEECETDEEGYYWSIDTREGVTIGTVALTEFNDYHGVANLGIVIGNKNYWGKGTATEVITALVDHAFAHLNLFHIGAEVEEGNVPMMKALEKVGFKQDGLFESARVKNGKRINVHHFSIDKRQ